MTDIILNSMSAVIRSMTRTERGVPRYCSAVEKISKEPDLFSAKT